MAISSSCRSRIRTLRPDPLCDVAGAKAAREHIEVYHHQSYYHLKSLVEWSFRNLWIVRAVAYSFMHTK